MGAITHPHLGAGEHVAGRGRGLLQRGRILAGRAERSAEAELLGRIRRGERDAFALLLREHQAAVFGYLRARLTEPADAEDLCQEVFLRCYEGRVRFDDKVVLRPWLLGIARNVLREHVRKVRRRREIGWTETALELDEWLADVPCGGSDAAVAELGQCVGSLGPSARQALDLRYRGQMKLSEIGAHLHRSEGAIKLLMFRARQALKSCLDRKQQILRDE